MPMIAGLKTRAMGSFPVSCSTTCVQFMHAYVGLLLGGQLYFGRGRMHRPSLPNQRPCPRTVVSGSRLAVRSVHLAAAGSRAACCGQAGGGSPAAVLAAVRPGAVVEASMDARGFSIGSLLDVPLLLQRSPTPHPPLRLAGGARIPCISFARVWVHSSAHRRVSPTSSTCMRGCPCGGKGAGADGRHVATSWTPLAHPIAASHVFSSSCTQRASHLHAFSRRPLTPLPTRWQQLVQTGIGRQALVAATPTARKLRESKPSCLPSATKIGGAANEGLVC